MFLSSSPALSGRRGKTSLSYNRALFWADILPELPDCSTGGGWMQRSGYADEMSFSQCFRIKVASLSGAVELQTKPQSKHAKASSANFGPCARVSARKRSPWGRNTAS